jgi:predicted Zn-dependent protease
MSEQLMASKEQVYDHLSAAIKSSKADETEILFSDYRLISIRFANNTIHQNVDETGIRASLRSIIGRKQARFETNSFTAESLSSAVDNALKIAKVMPDDNDLLPLPPKAEYKSVNSFDDQAARLEPDQCVEMVRKAISMALSSGVEAAGTLNVSVGPSASWGFVPPNAVANSRGLFGFHSNTEVDFSLTCKKGNGSGYAKRASHFLKDVSVEKLTDTAIQKAINSQNPRPLAPGRYRCLLEPLAVSELTYWIAMAFNALRYLEERTFIAGKLERKIGADNVTLLDDPYNPVLEGRPFDHEGVPSKRITLIEKGVARELLHDRRTAVKFKTESNGRSFDMPNAFGPIPSCVVMEGGSIEADQMIKSLDTGVLITRFWYTNYVDPRKGILTGMTRDGTFWVENGRIKHPVTNFRFNCNLEEFLNSISLLSKPVLVDPSSLAPAAIVENFNLESSTEF